MTSIQTTKLTSVVSSIETGRPATTPCLLGGGSPLSLGSTLRATGVFAGSGVSGVVSERPTQAPTADAAWHFEYVPAAIGAGLRIDRANGESAALNQHDRKMRAFRGLEPWRDPA